MRKILKSFMLFVAAGAFVLALSSCKKLTISVESTMSMGQEYTLVSNIEATWTSSDPSVVEINGNKAIAKSAGTVIITAKAGKKEEQVRVTVKADPINQYAPKWELNSKYQWNGNGMKYVILVSPVNEYDPFNGGFTATGNGKAIKQYHQRLVEQAYNIDIDYKEWASLAPWGPDRVKYVNENYLSKEIFTKQEAYVVQLACSWLPTIVKNGAVASLFNVETASGLFSEVNGTAEGDEYYIQNETHNQISTVNNNVYGYALGEAHADHMIYYNIDLVKELGLTDPAELWFQGKWTLSNFEEWVKTGQTNMSNTEKGKFVLDMGYPEFTVGLVASTGAKMTNSNPAQILFNKANVTRIIEKLQSWDDLGYYNAHGVADVTTNFIAGETVLHSGSVWFLRNAERFDPGKIDFKIGAVPYPADDGQGGVPLTTVNEAEALVTVNGEKLKDDNGSYIYGIDLSASTFRVPFTDGSCYSVLSIENGKNGINSAIAFHILHDLMGGEGKDPAADVTITPEQAYKTHLESKLDYPIHAAAILSAQNNTYFEMIEIVSMTVGGGSHFSGNALWMIIPNMIRDSNINPRTALNEVIGEYKAALKQMGFQVA